MKKNIGCIVLTIITFYIALIYNSDSFLFVFFGEIIIGTVLAVLCFISKKDVSVVLDMEENTVSTDGKIRINIGINHSNRVEMGNIAVKMLCINKSTGKKKKLKLYGNDSGIVAEYMPNYTGYFELRILSVCMYDYLGILSMPIKDFDGHTEKVLVLPELYDVPVFIDKKHQDVISSSSYNNKKNYYAELGDVNDIRNFRPGVRLRYILWKLTSKMDDIMVREEDLLFNDSIVIFLVFNGRKKEKTLFKEFIQVVASISNGIAKRGEVHYVSWYDSYQEDIVRHCVSDLSDVHYVIRMVSDLYLKNKKSKEKCEITELLDLYYQKYKIKVSKGYLSIDTGLSLSVNDEHITEYSHSALKKSLLECEIII